MLLNAIPGGLIPPEGITISFRPIRPEEVPADFVSAIGHQDTAVLVSNLLGRPVPANRVSVPPLQSGDTHFVVLYQGPRLPEGTTRLPEGATLVLYEMRAL